MSRPLKALFLMEDLCYGGTQKQNVALANGLDPSRFKTEILTLTGPTDLDSLVAPHIPVHHLGKGRRVHPLFFYKMGAQIKKLAPDVLIPCTALPNIWGRLWGKALDIPIVLGTCRGGGAPVRQHERLLWRLSRHIICNSPALVEAMKARGVPEDHLSYIPNGVDCEHFHPAAEGEKSERPLIVCVARLAADKDLGTLIDAFKILGGKDQGPCLRIVGEGPEEGRLKAKIAAVPPGIATRIELSGASADTAIHYRQANLFVLSSLREGQPNVILEAMSSALPVCATAVGGIPDLIKDGEGGYLSKPGDAQALAANMEKILQAPEVGMRMGAYNLEKAKNAFSFTKMISSHAELIEDLWCKFSRKNQKAL